MPQTSYLCASFAFLAWSTYPLAPLLQKTQQKLACD